MTHAEIEKTLKADIRWAIRTGVGWDPNHGAVFSGGEWKPAICGGVCAIGAHVMRNRPACEIKPNPFAWMGVNTESEVEAAAKTFGKSVEWVDTLYCEVMTPEEFRQLPISHKSAAKMAWRLADYAEAYQKRYRRTSRAA